MYQKNAAKKHVDLLLIGEGKNTMLLSAVSIGWSMIIHYIVKENNFVAIFYPVSLQKKH